VESVDLFDPQTFERGIPHDFFDRLREAEPVHWQPGQPAGTNVSELRSLPQQGFWAITRYRDVMEIALDQQRFSSERGTVVMIDGPEDRVAQLRLWMINQDAPRHTRLRKRINKGFTQRVVGRLEAHIRELCRGIVDGVARGGECEFVSAVASALPLLVIAERMGCPAADRGRLFDWSNRMIGFEDPEFTAGGDTNDAMLELFEYAGHLAKLRRDDPHDDLTSVLVSAEVDGERLDELSFNRFFVLLIMAGNETTRNAISGGRLALAQHPEQRARLAGDPRRGRLRRPACVRRDPRPESPPRLRLGAALLPGCEPGARRDPLDVLRAAPAPARHRRLGAGAAPAIHPGERHRDAPRAIHARAVGRTRRIR